MGLQHIVDRKLEPAAEIRELESLMRRTASQLGYVQRHLFKPTLGSLKRKRLEEDRARKETAQRNINARIAELRGTGATATPVSALVQAQGTA